MKYMILQYKWSDVRFYTLNGWVDSRSFIKVGEADSRADALEIVWENRLEEKKAIFGNNKPC